MPLQKLYRSLLFLCFGGFLLVSTYFDRTDFSFESIIKLSISKNTLTSGVSIDTALPSKSLATAESNPRSSFLSKKNRQKGSFLPPPSEHGKAMCCFPFSDAEDLWLPCNYRILHSCQSVLSHFMSLWSRSSVSTAFQSGVVHRIDPYSHEAGGCHHASQLPGHLLTHHHCPGWGIFVIAEN